ncbi:MAG TPA: molybdopterin-binding protein [Aromatoleum sp.]|uniref:competence/damage-inducible protein A n=1 Tax=Aromatoleum sp. TaxID=2307007 RepID=UPI002B482794|nr:molybdopterin-binding protein [Aromatoleum sp.]HJV28303.1 molybdopterin-binding protein [Aromatoleum sp.]
MAFGTVIVGDEILSGRRSDKHLAKLIEMLGARGLRLAWARYVGDDQARLVEVLRDSFKSDDVVFCFGGIGATPDDRTRQSAAEALGVEVVLHPEAEAIIRAKFDAEITEHRLRLGAFPAGSEIIPNPYNQIPGFAIRGHFFVPGFPVMAWPMVEAVLDTQFRHLHHGEDYVEAAVTVWDAYEGKLIDLMESLEFAYPELAVFSLPSVAEHPRERRSVELGVKGPASRVAAAMELVRNEILVRGYEWQDKV